MSLPQYSLSWDAYQSSICGGLSQLQQNGEFVDMTLAADGHIVKVHQLLMALSSPYLKELINSAPCQHPVIFLNNVNHKTLCSLLEYIYSGEVMVPADNFASFIATAKALHIRGLENVVSGQKHSSHRGTEESPNVTTLVHMNQSEAGITQVSLLPARKKVHLKCDTSERGSSQIDWDNSFSYNTGAEYLDHTGVRNDHDMNETRSSIANDQFTDLQYTVSNRGVLQVILNRYIYNLHSKSHKGGMRKWHCIAYRGSRCPAFVVTKGNVVLDRSCEHNHKFHDKNILAKIESKAIYSALEDVAGVKGKVAKGAGVKGKVAKGAGVKRTDAMVAQYTALDDVVGVKGKDSMDAQDTTLLDVAGVKGTDAQDTAFEDVAGVKGKDAMDAQDTALDDVAGVKGTDAMDAQDTALDDVAGVKGKDTKDAQDMEELEQDETMLEDAKVQAKVD